MIVFADTINNKFMAFFNNQVRKLVGFYLFCCVTAISTIANDNNMVFHML